MIIRTFDGLQALTTPAPTWSHGSSGSMSLYGLSQSYARIYATQPNVRICVDFLARNIAHLALQVFRRVSNTDRVRLVDHDLAQWLGSPNPATGSYRLTESLMADLGIYFNAYLIKIRTTGADGRDRIGLVRIPPEEMTVEGGLLPTNFCWTALNGRKRDFDPSEIVHFTGFNPLNPLEGLSPLETLRQILAEEAAAGEHRESYWRNAARVEGVVTRPKEKPRYTDTQVKSWREQWQAAYAGAGMGGKTALLQDGETFTATSWSAKDSEYTAGGKLRREVCAAEYHIPLPLVGILEHATFSNIEEQHKHLYQDCLGPWLKMLEQEWTRQLLIECDDTTDVYLEFNIDEKLKGTPQERAASIQLAVGRPWRTVNEARALENLPRLDDPELDTVAPQQGGPASNAATVPAADAPARPMPADDGSDASNVSRVLQAARTRQLARLAKVPVGERPSAFFADIDRWNRELTEDLTPIVGAADAARRALQANVATLGELDAAEEVTP